MATYYIKFEKEKKLSSTITRMANVTVFNARYKEINRATVWIGKNSDEVANMLIREYELSKIWNNKKLLINQ